MTEQSMDTNDIPVREEPFTPFGTGPDWRVWFGIAVSLVWILMLALYVSAQVGWSNISATQIDTMGSFLEGAFAPLAFLWFVLAYFSQQKELSQNTLAIKMQYVEIQRSAEQAVIQSQAIRASEMHARKESFLRIAEAVSGQLGAIMGFLYLSSQGSTASGAVSDDKISQLWSKMGVNDTEVFSRSMMEVYFASTPQYRFKLFYGTETRTRHTNNFMFNFERLLSTAAESDEDGMIRDALMGSTHGYVYNMMLEMRDNTPAGFKVGTYDFDPDTRD